MSNPKIVPDSLFETHLNVRDLDRAMDFYRDVVGLEHAYTSPQRQVAFFWIGGRGQSMLGLWAGGISPNTLKLHVAFRVDLESVLEAPSHLRACGVEPLDFFGNPANEPSVIGWMPAASVFFQDPDANLLEFIAMLPDAPRAEAGVMTYSNWQTLRNQGHAEG
ncbi:MAG: VOC family protein [Anaerolineales bacterium]